MTSIERKMPFSASNYQKKKIFSLLTHPKYFYHLFQDSNVEEEPESDPEEPMFVTEQVQKKKSKQKAHKED